MKLWHREIDALWHPSPPPHALKYTLALTIIMDVHVYSISVEVQQHRTEGFKQLPRIIGAGIDWTN